MQSYTFQHTPVFCVTTVYIHHPPTSNRNCAVSTYSVDIRQAFHVNQGPAIKLGHWRHTEKLFGKSAGTSSLGQLQTINHIADLYLCWKAKKWSALSSWCGWICDPMARAHGTHSTHRNKMQLLHGHVVNLVTHRSTNKACGLLKQDVYAVGALAVVQLTVSKPWRHQQFNQ